MPVPLGESPFPEGLELEELPEELLFIEDDAVLETPLEALPELLLEEPLWVEDVPELEEEPTLAEELPIFPLEEYEPAEE